MRPIDAKDMLATLLALDRMMVEVSMRVYNLSEADRLLMRKQNRRLHHLFRQHFRRLREAVSSLGQIVQPEKT
jgi:inorganic triphosphatase YgiF